MRERDLLDNELDAAQLVDEIRTAAADTEQADIDLLRDAAARYGELCDLVNRRLVACHDLLKRGFRSEAIQACERDSNVLTLVELLDFPERGQWCELLAKWGMAKPPSLKIDLAGDLNEAYAHEESLSSLLNKHRLLALARAPLESRISVLQGIRERDPNNPAWQEDVTSYEQARLKQIPSELKDAETKRDAERVRKLCEEVKNGRWTIPPDTELVRRCEISHKSFVEESAREQLVLAEKHLNDAYAEFDVNAAERAKETWGRCRPLSNLPSDDPLIERAEPALEWLAEQQRISEEDEKFKDKCSQFEAAVDDDATSQDHLDRLYHSLIRAEREIPKNLELRYRQRLQAHELARSRRFRLAMTGAIGVVIVLATLTSVFLVHRTKNRRIAKAASALEELLAAEDFDGVLQAHQELQAQDPDIASAPDVLAIREQAEAGRRKELDRKEAFERALSAAVEAGVENPDTASLNRARELARTHSEETDVAEFRLKLDRHRAKIQTQRDEAFREDFQEVRDLLEQIETDHKSGAPNCQRLVRTALSQLKQVVSEHTRASVTLKEQADILAMRLRAIQDELDLRERRLRLRDRLVRSVGDVDRYCEAAESYVDRFPKSALGASLKQVMRESPLWKGVLLWSSFLSSSELENIRAISPQSAETVLQKGKQLLEEESDVPLASRYAELEPFLECVASRTEDDGRSLVQSLTSLRKDPLISDTWMVQAKDGTRYYIDADSEPDMDTGAKSYRVSYIAAPDYSSDHTYVDPDSIVYNDRAPQAKLIESMVTQLSEMEPSEWEPTFRHIVRTLHEDPYLDPILEYLLLDRTLHVACEGSVLMESAFGEFSKKLSNAAVDLSLNWLNPENKEAMEVRKELSTLLSDLPKPEEVERIIDQQFQRFAMVSQVSVDWIGILVQATDGSWDCLTGESSSVNGHLLVVTHDAASGEVSLEQIGLMKKGLINWDEPFDDRFREGRPVFLREESMENGKKIERRNAMPSHRNENIKNVEAD